MSTAATTTAPTSAPPAPDSRGALVSAQIAAAVLNPATLLRIDAVEVLTGWHRATIWRRIKAGTFPASKDLGGGEIRWVAADVHAWLAKMAEGAAQ